LKVPVVHSDSNFWKISVAEEKVSKKQLEQPDENCHADCRAEKKKRNAFKLFASP